MALSNTPSLSQRWLEIIKIFQMAMKWLHCGSANIMTFGIFSSIKQQVSGTCNTILLLNEKPFQRVVMPFPFLQKFYSIEFNSASICIRNWKKLKDRWWNNKMISDAQNSAIRKQRIKSSTSVFRKLLLQEIPEVSDYLMANFLFPLLSTSIIVSQTV